MEESATPLKYIVSSHPHPIPGYFFFICVFTGSNFCAYMYMGYFLLFRPFFVTVQETMTTPSFLGEELDVF